MTKHATGLMEWARRVVDECAPSGDLVCVVMLYEAGGDTHRALAGKPEVSKKAIAIGNLWMKTGFSVSVNGVITRRVAARAVLGYELKSPEQVKADYAKAGREVPFA